MIKDCPDSWESLKATNPTMFANDDSKYSAEQQAFYTQEQHPEQQQYLQQPYQQQEQSFYSQGGYQQPEQSFYSQGGNYQDGMQGVFEQGQDGYSNQQHDPNLHGIFYTEESVLFTGNRRNENVLFTAEAKNKGILRHWLHGNSGGSRLGKYSSTVSK